MENLKEKEPGRSRLLRALVLSLAVPALTAAAARAGVEFVTPIGNCTNKVDTIGDGKDLFLTAGSNVQFEVFGNSVDLSNPTSGFRIATDSGAGNVTARIVSQKNGGQNLGRGCGNVGSAVVEVDSPANLTADAQRSLFFKMPLGDESRLQMHIRAIPTFTAVWTSSQNDISCIVKTGTFEKLDQDHKIRIQLPPGSGQDQTTCNQTRLQVRMQPATMGEIDVAAPVKFTATGLPNFLQADSPTAPTPASPATMTFTFNVAGVRALTAARTSNIVVASSNPARTVALTLEVLPGITNGFTQAANCRNLTTGDTVNANDLVSCELRLSIPPTNGQLITFEVQDRLCVAAGAPGVNYSPASGIGTTTLTGSGNIFEVLLRAVGGTMSTGQPCGSLTSPVQHQVKFWVGQRDIESGADFTLDTFRIRLNP